MCVLRWSADVSVKMYSRVNTHRTEWGADVLMSVFSSWLGVCVCVTLRLQGNRSASVCVCVCEERVPPRWAVPNEARSVSVGQTGLVFLRNQESWGGGYDCCCCFSISTHTSAAANPNTLFLMLFYSLFSLFPFNFLQMLDLIKLRTLSIACMQHPSNHLMP